MPVQQAISMYGEIELIHADVHHYWAVFNEILDALELKSPLVEGVELGDVYIGIDGLQLIYENDDVLAGAIRKAIPDKYLNQLLELANRNNQISDVKKWLHNPPNSSSRRLHKHSQ